MNQNQETQIIEHLFRVEAGKITSVLTKIFGLDRLEEVEDIVQDTFITAFEVWRLKGIPENPSAWLYKVAKNKFLNLIQRQANLTKIISMNQSFFPQEFIATVKIEEEIQRIDDNQIQLLFAVCHPEIQDDWKVALALKTICGFSVDEIAKSFLTTKDNINKRLYRAREKIKSEKIQINIPNDDEFLPRLSHVLKCIYLMFNEGYHSSTKETVIRKDLCYEAMRLSLLLIEYPKTNLPFVNALVALMCFHSSRFESRFDSNGAILSLKEQDRTLWNQELIEKGEYFLNQSHNDSILSDYYLEAMIAYFHLQPESDSKWIGLLNLYDKLLELNPNPMVELNRVYVLSKVYSPEHAILELKKIKGLEKNYLYFALLGELQKEIQDLEYIQSFQKAIHLSNSEQEKVKLQKKISDNLTNLS